MGRKWAKLSQNEVLAISSKLPALTLLTSRTTREAVLAGTTCAFHRHGGIRNEKFPRHGTAQHTSFLAAVSLGVAWYRHCFR